MIKVLRWLAVIPSVIISSTLLFGIIQLLGGFMGFYKSFPWLLSFIGSTLAFAMAIVIGVIVAPTNKRIVAVALSIAIVFLNGFALYGNLFYKEYYGIIEVAGGVLGAILGYYQAINHTDETKSK